MKNMRAITLLIGCMLPCAAISFALRETLTRSAESFSAQRRILLEPGVPQHVLGHARHYVREGRVTYEDELRLQIVLKHEPASVALLERTVLRVSDPRDSLLYGRYLSIADLTALIGADVTHVEAVMDLFLSYGVRRKHIQVNKNRDIITVRLAAPLAEEIFQTTLHRFRHVKRVEATIIRAISPYSLPESIAPLVSFVSELLRFPAIRALPFVPSASREGAFTPDRTAFNASAPPSDAAFQTCGQDCAGYVTPQVLADRYNLPTSLAEARANTNSIALAEFQFQHYDRRDLYMFGRACGVDRVSVEKKYHHNAAVVCTRGGGCIESLLDIEWANAASGGGAIPVSVYYLVQYSVLDWISAVNDNEEAELVHSVSYGNDEAQQVSEEYMQSVNTEFMKAAARGLSIFVASGDQGVYGREGPGNNVFHPDFPASSPWVTSVGGTDFVTPSVTGEEQAW